MLSYQYMEVLCKPVAVEPCQSDVEVNQVELEYKVKWSKMTLAT